MKSSAKQVHVEPFKAVFQAIVGNVFGLTADKDPVIQAMFKDVPKDVSVPKSVAQALKSEHKHLWKWAMDQEMKALRKMGTWIQVPYRKNTRMLGAMWVYDIKYNADLSVYKFKARLVARGDRQIPGLDYGETFAATAQMRTVRLLCVLALVFRAKLTHVDISNAFTNGELDEELYLRHPPGYPGTPGTMLKLMKSIYGLCQASRVWQLTLTKALMDIGFKQCVSDTCLFYHPDHLCFVSIHVDDILFLCDDDDFRAHVVSELKKVFKLTDSGVVSVYLGMNFAFPDASTCLINQTSYIRKMLNRFNLADVNPTKTPLPQNLKMTNADSPTTFEEKSQMEKKPYRALIGSLLYAARGTRPDISYAVGALAKFNQNPGKAHWRYAQHVLKYLKGTTTSGLVYKHESDEKKINIEIFSDSDWGSSPDDRRSVSGFVVCVNGNPISWCSRVQKTVALSSCEAEFLALSEAMREALWLRQLLIELDVGFVAPIIIRVDNQSAIRLAENPVAHQRSKHIDIRYMRIREEIRSGTIGVRYVPTGENLADLLTKSPTLGQFQANLPKFVGDADTGV